MHCEGTDSHLECGNKPACGIGHYSMVELSEHELVFEGDNIDLEALKLTSSLLNIPKNQRS